MLHEIAFTLIAAAAGVSPQDVRCATGSRAAHVIEVDINRRNQIFVDGKMTPIVGVRSKFLAASERYPHTYVGILADADARFGTVLQTLDAAKHAGLDAGFTPTPCTTPPKRG